MASNIGNVSAFQPQSYIGSQVPLCYIIKSFAPTPKDWRFTLPTLWVDTTTQTCYILVSKAGNVAVWEPFGSGIQEITIPGGTMVFPASGQLFFSASGGLTISNPSPNTINFAISAEGITWNDVTVSPTSMQPDNGYLANTAGLCSFTLPTTAAQFSSLFVVGNGSGGWVINQNSGQNIILGNVTATVSTGTVFSTNRYDKLELLCTVANTTWTAVDIMGNPSYT